MPMTQKKILIGLSLAALIGASAYYFANRTTTAQRFKLQAIENGTVKQSVSANGTLNPVSLVLVGTQVSGTVKHLYADFNDQVKEGQVLAALDDALFTAQARQSLASVASAEAALELAQANEKRYQSLLAQEYVSRQDFDQAVKDRKAAQAQLDLARASRDKDKANLGYSVIKSPVSGVIVARNVDVGQTVAASFQTPTLFQIAKDLSKMQIDSSFAEADIGNIKVGQAVRFNVDAFPNKSFKGEVRQIRLNPTNQQNVVTYNVVVGVDNPELILLPGMTAYVNIVVAQKEDVLLVPNAALRFKPPEDAPLVKQAEKADKSSDKPGDKPAEKGSEKAGDKAMAGEKGQGGDKGRRRRDANAGNVYVLEGGKLKAVSVQLGITDNRSTEVTGGELKPGDQVVVGEVAPAAAGAPKSVGLRMF